MTDTSDIPGRETLQAAMLAMDEGEVAAAGELLRGYLQHHPDSEEGVFLLGTALLESNQPALSRFIFRHLASRHPKRVAVWCNLGRACLELLLWAEAQSVYRRALEIDPTSSIALNGLASCALHLGNVNTAEQIARELLAKDADDDQAHSTLAHALLAQGRYGEGWDEYVRGVGRQQYRDLRQYNGEPQWSGNPRQRVAVYAEQGIGDQIAFMEGFNDFRKQAQVVLVNCHPKLRGLFARSFHDVAVYGDQFDADPGWPERAQIEASAAMSVIPQTVRRRAERFTGDAFLIPDHERVTQWRHLLDCSRSLKVGIAWTGGSFGAQRADRSTTLDTFEPLLRLPGVSFVCLEYKDRTAEIEAARVKYGCVIRDWPRATQSQDIDDVAGLIAALDVVVSVPTAAVHIAGGLGIPTHCITHPVPHFHYGRGDAMPYYGSVTCHHRKTSDAKEWTAAMAQIADRIGGIARAA